MTGHVLTWQHQDHRRRRELPRLHPRGWTRPQRHHDRDASGALERNGFGAPREPYGFSNNARGRFGPPSWGKARFRVAAPRTAIEVDLK